MKATPRLLAAAAGALALLAARASAQQAQFIPIPDSFDAKDITPDGEIVVGTGTGGAYYWHWKTDPAPTYIGGNYAVAVSDDGSVIAGFVDDPTTGADTIGRWTQATGWESLGYLPTALQCPSLSTPYDISADGTKIVGLSWNGCNAVAVQWTQATGVTGMAWLANGQNRATAIAGNGSRAVGFAQGSFSRTPALWDPTDGSGQVLNADDLGEFYGVTEDGSTVVGEYNGEAAFWTELGGVVPFGSLNGDPWVGAATDLSLVNGNIVGYDYFMLSREAWIWNASTGFEQLRGKLASYGVPNLPAALDVVTRMSADGQVLVGSNVFGSGWIVVLPGPAAATVYGCGLNPAGSMSVVSGLPELGTTITLGVDNPLGTQPGGSFAALVLAAKPLANFPCGLPAPGYGMAAPGAAGELLIDPLSPYFVWPVGAVWPGPSTPAPIDIAIPPDPTLSGLHLFTQGILWDHTGTSGIDFGLTDAVDMRIGP